MGLLGKNEWILRADYSMTVGRWFIEGLVDLGRYARNSQNIGHLLVEISERLREIDPMAPQDEIQAAARQLTTFAWREVEARRNVRRERIDRALRDAVWFRDEPLQRCYLCGYRFSEHAKNLFLRRSRVPLAPHKLVDFTRPRGVNPRHLRVELDHVIPVAEGGKTNAANLRLACGWCNNAKSSLWSVYDAKAWSIGVIQHPSLGHISVPQPLWMLRMVATRARCEVVGGCGARLTTDELFIAPRIIKGALTPTNLMVVCRRHDPWVGQRLVSPTLLPKR
ncbi:HNH endonuclease [Streptomyces sp. WC2508]|uniref:HNH endonuclease n=1 Tax=Streptomyces sp. WC2508 TaxID=3461405 RepID=UPI00404492B7